MFIPSHVGGFILREVIEPREMTVTDAAKVLGVGRVALSALLNERKGLSTEMAVRLEAAFGVRAETLLQMQLNHEIAVARQRQDEITRGVKRVA